MKYPHVRILLILSLVFAWLGFRSSPVFAAGNCKNTTCEDLFASSMGCPGYTAGAVKILSDGLSTVETRASSAANCDAKWARTYNMSGGSRYAAASLRYGCTNFCYSKNISSSSPIASSSTVGVLTRMHAFVSTPTRSCGKVSTTGPIAVPIAISSLACTNVN
jgi:hypothetical protein